MCEHGSRFGNHPWPPAGLLGRTAGPGCSVFLRPTRTDEAWRPRPRLPHVRDCRTRAFLRGVPRKGNDSRLAAQAQAPAHAVDRTRSCRSAAIRCSRCAELERAGRFSTDNSGSRRGESTPFDQGRGRTDSRLSPARCRHGRGLTPGARGLRPCGHPATRTATPGPAVAHHLRSHADAKATCRAASAR